MPDNEVNLLGIFVPTTNVWDVGSIYEMDVKTPEFKELLVRLYQNINNIANVLNVKTSGYYINVETNSSNQYYNLANPTDPLNQRPGFICTVDIGALGAGITSVNHGINAPTGITSSYKWMKIYGAATKSSSIIGCPLPFAGATGNNIEVTVTATQVVINNQSGNTFTDATVILEYVKS